MVLFCAGCLSDSARIVPNDYWQSLKPKPPHASPDVVEVQYIFIEREIGDPDVNELAWLTSDEQAIPLEMKARLNSNGLRIASLGDRLTPQLQGLLRRSNPTGKGRLQHGRSGEPVKIQMTPILSDFRFTSVFDDRPQDERFANGQGYLVVVPSISEDTAVRLTVSPEIEHGARTTRYTPAVEHGGWKVTTERERFELRALSVGLEVDSGGFVLVGARTDRPGTLGHSFFIRPGVDGRPAQALLLIRVLRPSREDLFAAGYDADDFVLSPLLRFGRTGRSPASETFFMSQ
jgi:hypothetical protein